MNKIFLISLISAGFLASADIKFKEAPSSITRAPMTKIDNNIILSYHNSIATAKKSVVNISTTKKVSRKISSVDNMFNDPFFKEFFGFNFGIPQERSKVTSLGSGVIISKDGYIVTNNHVIENSKEITVFVYGVDKEYKAKLIGTDPKTDLAVIKIEKENLEPIIFADSSKVLEGDLVFAIGNPFGVGSSITRGIISALNKNNIGLNQYENFIQTDASINPGNSGGALVDSRGALVGINSAILSRGGDSSGIGFAIPSSMVKDVVKKLVVDGKIDRGYMGIVISNLNEAQKELYKNKKGALVTSVEKDFPAYKAGIKRGDLIISIDNKDIKNANDLKNTVGSFEPNKKIDVKFERNKNIISVSIKLMSMNFDSSKLVENSGIEGLSLSNLTRDIKMTYKIPYDLNGVIVTDVKSGSKANEFGFEKGDIIMQVGDSIVTDIKSFILALQKSNGAKTLAWINRNSVVQGLVVKQDIK